MKFVNWRRFSLRSLFILMTLTCLAVGTWSVYVNPYRLQLRSLAEVNRLQGNSAKSFAEGPAWHRWLVTTMLGNDAFVHVTDVDLNNRQVDDNALRTLGNLKHLERLSLDYTQITDEATAVLRSMPRLETLSLRYTKVSDRCAADLATLAGLKHVYLTGTKMTDAAINDLAKHAELSELYVRWTQITNDGATRLAAALPHCAVYHHALSAQ